MTAYLAEIARTPLLDSADELALARLIRRARRRLVDLLATSRFVLRELQRTEWSSASRRGSQRPDSLERAMESGLAEWDRLANRFRRQRSEGGRRRVRWAMLRCGVRLARGLRCLELAPDRVDRLARNLIGLQRRLAGTERTLARVRRRRRGANDAWVRGELEREVRRLELSLRSIEERAGGSRRSIHELAAAAEERLEGLERAKAKLVRANLRLVVSVARVHAANGASLADLIQEGNLGLMRAADDFDPDRGCRFSTYATWWIRRAVLRGLAEARAVRLPLHVLEAAARMVRSRTSLAQSLGRQPTEEELAESLDLAPEKVRNLLGLTRTPVSIDAPGDSERETLAGRIEHSSATAAEASLNRRDERKRLRSALQGLTEREARILALRFGLGPEEEWTLAEVARRFRVSPKRIGQIQSEALDKLRRAARDSPRRR